MEYMKSLNKLKSMPNKRVERIREYTNRSPFRWADIKMNKIYPIIIFIVFYSINTYPKDEISNIFLIEYKSEYNNMLDNNMKICKMTSGNYGYGVAIGNNIVTYKHYNDWWKMHENDNISYYGGVYLPYMMTWSPFRNCISIYNEGNAIGIAATAILNNIYLKIDLPIISSFYYIYQYLLYSLNSEDTIIKRLSLSISDKLRNNILSITYFTEVNIYYLSFIKNIFCDLYFVCDYTYDYIYFGVIIKSAQQAGGADK
ncbi:MAG: hypothetical protein AABZ39_04485 [Spirochaetota bacterium]